MSEYISREAARPDAFCEGVSCQDCPFCKDPVQGGCRIDDFVKSIPAADVVEVRHEPYMALSTVEVVAVRHGRWLRTPTGWVYCSVCGEEPPEETNARTKYCPSCGAKMDGGRDDV